MPTKRPVALLDIDDTLLHRFGTINTRLNTTLLNSLKNKGIVDVYLFTDMGFDNFFMSERILLVRELRKRGFVVHEVITPNDLTWQVLPTKKTEKLQKSFSLQAVTRTTCEEAWIKAIADNHPDEECPPGAAILNLQYKFKSIDCMLI